MHSAAHSSALREWTGSAATVRGPMSLAVGAALGVHLLLLLGIGFEQPDPAPPPVRTLALMTVEQPAANAAEPPPDAVQAQLDRAGEASIPLPDLPPGTATEAPPADPPPTVTTPLPAPADTAAAGSDPAASRPASPRVGPSPAGTDTAADALRTRRLLDTSQETMAGILSGLGAAVPLPEPAPAAPSPVSAPDAGTIFATRGDEIAALNARINARHAEGSGRERRKAISTHTKEYRYAAYMEAWRRKVEQIGNLNYPPEARERALFGSLILHVAVRADGSLEGVRVVRSSGHEVLDEAAVKIVRLAAPFAPFPDDIKAETDVLDITRVWQFQRNHRLGWRD